MNRGEEDVTLDLSGPNPSKVDVSTRSPYGVVTKVYRAKNGCRISSIADNGKEVWKAKDGHSCTHVNVLTHGDKRTHMNIYVRDKEGTKMPLYYARDDEEWNTIEEDAFYSSFHIEAVKGSVIDVIALDIKGNNDASKLYVNDSPNFQFTAYAPNVGYRIKAVKEGSTKIWTAKYDGEGCLYASFYPRDRPILAYLMVGGPTGMHDLYLAKKGTTWTSVDKDEYLNKLRSVGFNESAFSNEIILDISNADKHAFHQHFCWLDEYSVTSHTPLPGYLLTSVTAGTAEIWTAEDGEYCTYVDVYGKKHEAITLYLLVKDKEGGRRIVYYAKLDGSWKNVEKSDYHALMPIKVNGMTPQKGDGRIVMSSFRNKQGLKIATYSATVDNARANIILIHGLRSHFMSTFCASNADWNIERFNFHFFHYVSHLGGYEAPKKVPYVDRYRHLFDYRSLDGKDASLVQPAYEYEGSLIEFLNKLGYNVYGMDLQSHGLSDGISVIRCHVEKYVDYICDVMQFVNIIRRGKFEDSSEVWDESMIFKNIHSDRKTILLGDSMGGNIAMQAIQEFYKTVKSSKAILVDGLIGLSAMLDLEFYLNTWYKKLARSFFKLHAWYSPEKPNPHEKPLDYGEALELFIRYRDPFFKTSKLTYKTTLSMFYACDDVSNNMAYYPKSLPTLLFHTKDDSICDVNGPRDMMATYFKDSKVAKLVEFEGNFHYLTVPQAMVILQPYLKEWLDKHI